MITETSKLGQGYRREQGAGKRTHNVLLLDVGCAVDVEQHGHVVGIIGSIEFANVEEASAGQAIGKVLRVQRGISVDRQRFPGNRWDKDTQFLVPGMDQASPCQEEGEDGPKEAEPGQHDEMLGDCHRQKWFLRAGLVAGGSRNRRAYGRAPTRSATAISAAVEPGIGGRRICWGSETNSGTRCIGRAQLSTAAAIKSGVAARDECRALKKVAKANKQRRRANNAGGTPSSFSTA